MAGVLEGITVVDLSRLVAGPYSTMALADLGARVIKVEALAGEDGRHLGPPFYGESSVTFMSCNRGKESLALDLRKPAGRDILNRLIKRSQVVVHNFRPDFAEKYALTYDDVRALQPEVIYAVVTAFGEQGAYCSRPAVDSVVQGMAGGFYASGNEGDDPIRMGIPLVDVACGMCGAFGILAAVIRWRQTGRGQPVETVLVDTMFNLMAAKVAEHAVEQREPARAVNLPIAAPSRHCRAGDGPWFSVSVLSDGAVARFFPPLVLSCSATSSSRSSPIAPSSPCVARDRARTHRAPRQVPRVLHQPRPHCRTGAPRRSRHPIRGRD